MLWSTLRYLVLGSFVAAIMPLGFKAGFIPVYTVDLALIPLVFVLAALVTTENRLVFTWQTADKILVLLVMTITMLGLFSTHPINTIEKVSVWFRMTIFYFSIRLLFENNQLGINDLYKWWKWFAVFLGILGAIQVFIDPAFGVVANYFGNDRDANDLFFLEGLGEIPRISGTAFNPLIYVQWIVLFSALVNAKILFCEEMTPRTLFWLGILLAVESALVIATLARGGVMYFAVVNVFLIYMRLGLYNESKAISFLKLILVIGVVLIGVLTFLPIGEFAAVRALEARTELGGMNRIYLVEQGWKLLQIPKVLFMGTGLGAYYPALFDYQIGMGDIVKWKDMSESASGIHNLFFNLLVEGGIFTLILFLSFYISSLRRASRVMMILRNTDNYYLGVFLWVVLLAFGLVSFELYISSLHWAVLIFEMTIFALVHSVDLEYLKYWAAVQKGFLVKNHDRNRTILRLDVNY
jgi:hypothetical protein